MNNEIIEEIMNHFGRTGSKFRPRIRKFHCELLYSKFKSKEKVICKAEISRPNDYIKRMVKFSKGWIEFINLEKYEMKLTDKFFNNLEVFHRRYNNITELDHSDENLSEQGILIKDNEISFNGKLTYSRFYKIISDEGESMNDPKNWKFNDVNIESYPHINFAKKDSAIFSSNLFLLKFYVLRKIEEVAFVTSRFVHCPVCGANYVIPASKITFQSRYQCENVIGDKVCNTTLKKFPVRKMIPTYIYEISIEIQNKESVEYKDFFLESFKELTPGFYTGMLFGRIEPKSNAFYFTGLTAKLEKTRIPFQLIQNNQQHGLFNVIDSVLKHIKKIGFVIEDDKAKLPVIIETIKKLMLLVNKDINLDHSLYFGAPGIGKTYSLTLLHQMYYPNAGFISGPRFSLPGLTGGQKDIFYQDSIKRKHVPGLFSTQAFIFDEINNAQFLEDNKAMNLFKSAALAPSGTSSTVGGKEFARISLVAGTANYNSDHLNHYENKIKLLYKKHLREKSNKSNMGQKDFLELMTEKTKEKESDNIKVLENFDYFRAFSDYGIEVPSELRKIIMKVRQTNDHFLTNFPLPLMERFYWTILVHPKFDKYYVKEKDIDVVSHLRSRKSKYSQRELLSQLYITDFDELILEQMKETMEIFEDLEIERKWSQQAQIFLRMVSIKYASFFSMFSRIKQVHVFILYTLSLINGETYLSRETMSIFEKIISLLHVPITIEDFHTPNFKDFKTFGNKPNELYSLIKLYPNQNLTQFIEITDDIKKLLVKLENNRRIERINQPVSLIEKFIYVPVEKR